jgi:hypothetical protein
MPRAIRPRNALIQMIYQIQKLSRVEVPRKRPRRHKPCLMEARVLLAQSRSSRSAQRFKPGIFGNSCRTAVRYLSATFGSSSSPRRFRLFTNQLRKKPSAPHQVLALSADRAH